MRARSTSFFAVLPFSFFRVCLVVYVPAHLMVHAPQQCKNPKN